MPTKNQAFLICIGNMANDLGRSLEKVLTTLLIKKLPRNKVIFIKVFLPSKSPIMISFRLSKNTNRKFTETCTADSACLEITLLPHPLKQTRLAKKFYGQNSPHKSFKCRFYVKINRYFN